MSRYGISCTFKIEHLSSQLLLKEGYSDKFFIDETGSNFKANLKYPKLDIDEESMDVRIKILESSQLEMEATKGTVTEGLPSLW